MTRLSEDLKRFIASNISGLSAQTDVQTSGNVRCDSIDTDLAGLQVVVFEGQAGERKLFDTRAKDFTIETFGDESGAFVIADQIFELFNQNTMIDLEHFTLLRVLLSGDVIRRGQLIGNTVNYGIELSIHYKEKT